MKPLYNYKFTLRLMSTGETHKKAWDEALSVLVDRIAHENAPLPDEIARGVQPAINVIPLECSICGEKEQVREDDFGQWAPEVYLGNHCLGNACPKCQSLYCQPGEDDVLELLLGNVDFREGRCKALLDLLVTTIGSQPS